jgi:hypothetical protein
MRRYDILSGILLTLPIIGFALAAPVQVQEKRQSCVDVVHLPRDAITVLEKRANEDEDFEKFVSLVDGYIKTWKETFGTSNRHASSSSALPGPEDGPTNVVQAPVPNPASPSANLNPLIKPSSPLTTASPALSPLEGYDWLHEPDHHDAIHRLLNAPTSPGHGLEHKLSSAPPGPDDGSMNAVQAPVPNPTSSTADPNPLAASPALSDSEEYDWLHELEGHDEIHRLLNTPTTPTSPGHGLGHELSSAPPPPGPDDGSTNPPPVNPGPTFDGHH